MDYTTDHGTLEQFDQGHAEAVEALKRCATQDVKAYFLVVGHDVSPDDWAVNLFYSCPTGQADNFEGAIRKAVTAL